MFQPLAASVSAANMKSGSERLGSMTCPPDRRLHLGRTTVAQPTGESRSHVRVRRVLQRKGTDMGAPRPSRPEPADKHGAALLSDCQLALLHGLFDRPAGRATSTADLVRAAVPYARLLTVWTGLPRLERAARTLSPAWVARERAGRHMTWQLTDRGRAIEERGAAARLRGRTVYRGLEPIAGGAVLLRRQREAVDAQWLVARQDPALAQLTADADALIHAWASSVPASGMYQTLRRNYLLGGVRFFVCRFTLRHRRLPRGTHQLTVARDGCDLRVDFGRFRTSW